MRRAAVAPTTVKHAKTSALAVVLLACVAAQPAVAQQADPARKQAQQQLDTKRQQLQDTERREQNLKADLAQIDQEREQVTRRLLETARLVQSSEARMSALEARLGELEAQEKMVRGSLAQRQDSISQLLAAMQRMGRNPPPVIVTRREDALEMVRSAMLLARAFPELKGQAEELAARLGELVRVMNEIRTEGDKLRSETVRLNDARTRLASLIESKRKSLADRQRELDEVRSAAAEIAKNVTDLSELISKLDQTVKEKTGLGSYESEQAQAAQQAPGAGQDPAGDQTKLALAPVPRAAVELVPGGPWSADPGRMRPAIAFQNAKAQLPLPAHGKRVISYGEKTQYGTTSRGIVIETRPSAQVISPCDGWVLYAAEFRTYGQILIINAGNGYYVLLAGLSHINVQVGQFVLAAEPVGTMPASPSSAAKDTAPVLYVEFRKEGRPIDPDPWWVEGLQKVQG
jgi:murein hydrolase activator